LPRRLLISLSIPLAVRATLVLLPDVSLRSAAAYTREATPPNIAPARLQIRVRGVHVDEVNLAFHFIPSFCTLPPQESSAVQYVACGAGTGTVGLLPE
jgi:hypothetical protein